MERDDQLPWKAQDDKGADKRREWDHFSDKDLGNGSPGKGWEKPFSSDRLSWERGDLFGDEDGGQEPGGGLFGDEDTGQEP